MSPVRTAAAVLSVVFALKRGLVMRLSYAEHIANGDLPSIGKWLWLTEIAGNAVGLGELCELGDLEQHAPVEDVDHDITALVVDHQFAIEAREVSLGPFEGFRG